MTGYKQYWLTVKVKPHATHNVRHSDKMWLRAYFDENPKPDEKKGIRTPTEHGSVNNLNPKGEQIFHFLLTKEEYEAAQFNLYMWVEPYGSAALHKDGQHKNLAVGRLKLENIYDHKGALTVPPPSSQPCDEQIVIENVELTQSVVEWTAEQMNANAASTQTYKMKKLAEAERLAQQNMHKAAKEVRESANPFAWLGAMEIMRSSANTTMGTRGARNFIMGRMGHPDDTIAQYAGQWQFENWMRNLEKLTISHGLDGVLLGGGDWDLKPRISPVWGDNNRLGNEGYYISNDNFSNLHYGFVAGASGFDAPQANWLADIVGGDTALDQKVTWKGVQLFEAKKGKPVTWQDIAFFVVQTPESHVKG